jgi:hypothetical protein
MRTWLRLLAAALGLLSAGPARAQELSPEEEDDLKQTLARYVESGGDLKKVIRPLFELYESRAVPFFTRALRADGKNVRNVEFCTQFLWYAASLRGELVADSEQALIGVLKSRQPVASTRAAWALGDLCSENAKHELIQALDADDPTLPGAACMVLGLLGGDDARQALLKVQAAPHLYGERTVRASQEALDLLIRLCVPDVG